MRQKMPNPEMPNPAGEDSELIEYSYRKELPFKELTPGEQRRSMLADYFADLSPDSIYFVPELRQALDGKTFANKDERKNFIADVLAKVKKDIHERKKEIAAMDPTDPDFPPVLRNYINAIDRPSPHPLYPRARAEKDQADYLARQDKWPEGEYAGYGPHRKGATAKDVVIDEWMVKEERVPLFERFLEQKIARLSSMDFNDRNFPAGLREFLNSELDYYHRIGRFFSKENAIRNWVKETDSEEASEKCGSRGDIGCLAYTPSLGKGSWLSHSD